MKNSQINNVAEDIKRQVKTNGVLLASLADNIGIENPKSVEELLEKSGYSLDSFSSFDKGDTFSDFEKSTF